MTLRTRIALIVSIVSLTATAAGYALQRGVLYERFVELEREQAIEDLDRCENAVRREIQHLALSCGDWATWDETYEFALGENPKFVEQNFNAAAMENIGWSAVWIVAADGAVRFRWAYDFETPAAIEIPELPTDRFPADHPLLPRKHDRQAASGIVATRNGPMMVASRPILTSEQKGPPAGWIVIGRLLSETTVQGIGPSARLRFHAWNIGDDAVDAVSAAAVRRGDASVEGFVHEASDLMLHVVGTMDDVYGKPAVVIRADLPRSISKMGAQTIDIATATLAVSGAITVIVLIFVLGASVAAPLRRLTDHAVGIGASGNLAARSGIVRGDEIGTLANAFDGMVGNLAESREQFSDVARRAGMADVARGVLHNAGNVLTSVNVSADAIGSTLRRSRANGILRAAQLLDEHKGDLAAFMASERGRLLPEYIEKASRALEAERDGLIAESEKLQRAVAHAAEIVARQGDFADGPSLAETMRMVTAVSAACALVEPTYRRHGIDLERKIDGEAVVVADRAKLAQVLVNLLTNAKEALLSRETGRRVEVRGEAVGDRARIVVRDNGCGIAAADLARIFASGFSTKRTGRGFGLHFCAISAREMGGSLKVESDGPGKGAVFTLDLPAVAVPESAAPARDELVRSAK
jgi:two-component system, NtrC family, sensor kinase